MKPKTLTQTGLGLAAALAVGLQIITACTDTERLRGRTTEQVKRARDPQQHTPEECARELDKLVGGPGSDEVIEARA